MRSPVLLVMAKAPQPGLVKTRLGRSVGLVRAADLAAAALLDTLDAATLAFGHDRCHLAFTGDLDGARSAREVSAALTGWTLHRQRGESFAARLRHAHEDVAAAGRGPVVQIGMDTPQLQPDDLLRAGRRLTEPGRAVLGPAYDGGWWLLGVGSPGLVAGLGEVAMSTATTCARTGDALRAAGARVCLATEMRDVDTAADASLVAEAAPWTRFAQVWRDCVVAA